MLIKKLNLWIEEKSIFNVIKSRNCNKCNKKSRIIGHNKKKKKTNPLYPLKYVEKGGINENVLKCY
jgi:hypothetical protein